MTLHTFDFRGRRRSTGGDLFTCALRNPGPLPDASEGEELTLLTPENPARDLNNGTHELVYSFERAGDFSFLVRLDEQVVAEVGVRLEAGPTDAATCDLALNPPNKGQSVSMTAGGTLAFAVTPRDRFGNSSAHRDDADVSRFRWKLQRLPDPPIKDEDGDVKEVPPPPPEAPVNAFETLEGAEVRSPARARTSSS